MKIPTLVLILTLAPFMNPTLNRRTDDIIMEKLDPNGYMRQIDLFGDGKTATKPHAAVRTLTCPKPNPNPTQLHAAVP